MKREMKGAAYIYMKYSRLRGYISPLKEWIWMIEITLASCVVLKSTKHGTQDVPI